MRILASLPHPPHAGAEEAGAAAKAVAEATGIPALKALAASDRKPTEKLAALAAIVAMAYAESSEPLPAGDPEHAVEAAKSKLEGRKRFLEESLSDAEREFRATGARPDAVAEAESKVRDLEAGIRFGERVHLDALGGSAEISALLSHVGSHPSLNRGVSVPVRLSDAFDTETVARPVAESLCKLLGRKTEDLFAVPDYGAMKRFDTGANPPREITSAYLRTLLADPSYGPPVVTSGSFDRRAMEARLAGEKIPSGEVEAPITRA